MDEEEELGFIPDDEDLGFVEDEAAPEDRFRQTRRTILGATPEDDRIEMGDDFVDADAPIKDAPSMDFDDPEVLERAQAAEDQAHRRGRVRDILYPEDDGSVDSYIRENFAGGHRALANAGYESFENPEAFAVGAGQGLTSNLLDELAGQVADTGLAYPLPFQGEAGREADEAMDRRTAEASERSPNAFGAGHTAGGMAQAAAVPIPGVSGLPWYARAGAAIGEAAAFGGLGAAGAADDGDDRLDAFVDGAVESAPYGLIGFGLGTAGDMMSRSPGAMRGAGEDLAAHGDNMRLESAGIRGEPARRQLDERWGGTRTGRREFAQELRRRHVGERMGIPMPGPALDDAFTMRASVGPDIGNPLSGTPGRIETEIDELGGYVDLADAGDDLAGSIAHEMDDVGSAGPAVQTALVEPLRERGPVPFSAAHRQRQQFQQREFAGVPEEYTVRAGEIISEHLNRAAQGADLVRAERMGVDIDFVDLGNRVEQQLIAEGAAPEVARQIADDLRDAAASPTGPGPGPLQRATRVRDQLPLRERLRARADADAERFGVPGTPPAAPAGPVHGFGNPPPSRHSSPDALAAEASMDPAARPDPFAGVSGASPVAPPLSGPSTGAQRPSRRRPPPVEAAPPPPQPPVDVHGDTGPAEMMPPPAPVEVPQVAQAPQAGPVRPGTRPTRRRRPMEVAVDAEVPAAPPMPIEPGVPPGPPRQYRVPPEYVYHNGQWRPPLPEAFANPEVPPEQWPDFDALPGRTPDEFLAEGEVPAMASGRVPVPDQYISRAQRAIDEEVAARIQGQGPTLSQQWADANRTYGVGADVLRLGRGRTEQTGLEIGAGQATRDAMMGDPSGLARLHATRAASGVIWDVGRGAYTRGVEATAGGLTNLADGLTRLLGENPQALGPYAQELAQVMQRGQQAVNAWHYQQAMSDPAYREMLEQNGLGTQDDTGEDPAIYDMLGEGFEDEEFYR